MLEAFAYHELRTPVLEYTPLFVRSVGEVTDVVEKQMYTFDDRDGRSVSLRPEGTASAVRAYVENAQWNKEPVTRWYYIGPMFRHERAQRGRLRQFYQVGAEVFGSGEPSMDAEMIAMLVDDAGALRPGRRGHRGQRQLAGRTRGARGLPRQAGRILLAGTATSWTTIRGGGWRRIRCASSTRRTRTCMALVAGRAQAARRARRELAGALRARARAAGRAGCRARRRPALVRGLDYYTGTIFEIKTTAGELGAQNTVRGGGRYDRLVASLGGQKTPAIGFALGIERALLAIPEAPRATSPRWRSSSRRWTGRRWISRCRSRTRCAAKGSASRSSTAPASWAR